MDVIVDTMSVVCQDIFSENAQMKAISRNLLSLRKTPQHIRKLVTIAVFADETRLKRRTI